MKTGLTKAQKITEIVFDEKETLIHIRTHNTDLKKRLAAYAAQHPGECRQLDADPDTGCMEFAIRKGRLSFRLTAPYSEERRKKASRQANQRMPDAEEAEHLCEIIYAKVRGVNYCVPYEDVRQLYQKRLIAYESRVQKDAAGVTLDSLEKKPKAKKTGKKPRPKKKRKAAQAHEEPWQDDRFFFIAGYTSGGASYGVMWEEMGLRPWQSLEDDDSLLDDI